MDEKRTFRLLLRRATGQFEKRVARGDRTHLSGGGGFGYTLTPLGDGRVVSYMVMDDSPAAKAEYILALDGKPIKGTRRLRYPFSARENPCLPQPSAALNNATNRFKQQMAITLFSKTF